MCYVFSAQINSGLVQSGVAPSDVNLIVIDGTNVAVRRLLGVLHEEIYIISCLPPGAIINVAVGYEAMNILTSTVSGTISESNKIRIGSTQNGAFIVGIRRVTTTNTRLA
jgi:hypothetical protein